MHPQIRILIADDHPIFRQGLRQIILAQEDLSVVSEAEDGETALRQIRDLKPDIAILDLDMPKLDGLAVTRAVRNETPNLEIIILTMHKGEDILNEALDLGVKGFVVKDSAVTDIVGSIRAVLAGQHFISPSVSSYLVGRAGRTIKLENEKPGLRDLTPTERRVLYLVAENKTSREIAAHLGVSTRTIENHRVNICQKLELRGAHALLKFAMENKSHLGQPLPGKR
jgi:DNA-binding NarL/FixJ family response regulator